MYDFVDRPVIGLDPASRFLVWSMRSWVATIGNAACPASVIAPAFARWRAIEGLQPFHRMMLLIRRDALEPFRFCTPGCRRVCEDEAILLSLVRLAAMDPAGHLRETLSFLVDEDAVGDLLHHLCELARAMSAVRLLPGFSLPPGK
ncbi:MAG: hypothetical protein N2423_06470 [Novosphingobium sp.]|nr:hypothetical protein [Novosphingobium sp.]